MVLIGREHNSIHRFSIFSKKEIQMQNKKLTDRMKAIAASRFPDAYPEAVTKVISNGQQPVWQSHAKKFAKPEKDVIFAWGIDGQGEKSFRFYRVPATMLPKLLHNFLDEHRQRLELVGEEIRDLNKKKYTNLHITRDHLEKLGLSPQRLE
jgi:hypothetical protein